ncbi:STAS domain-containing protein [Arsenicicoccus sp. oral taxon 190]|uniref:STAS domain-containing protein n=1 Tax=Arsenicicoccus sp. oral taxon 190 TaxID=1658671 RepID=UPI00067CE124|nr:STAS domain-containing protein [Arsenicicoccus sp. oral taxon 190]
MTVQLTHSVADDERLVLHARGALDIAETPRLAQAIDHIVAAGGRRLALDLTDLEFIDSTAIDAVVPRVRALRQLGGDLVVVASAERIVRPFVVSGTDRVLAIVGSLADADPRTELERARHRRRTGRQPAGPSADRAVRRKAS